jgi:hypothetical protein
MGIFVDELRDQSWKKTFESLLTELSERKGIYSTFCIMHNFSDYIGESSQHNGYPNVLHGARYRLAWGLPVGGESAPVLATLELARATL